LLVHFDRGSQYASAQYQALLSSHGFVSSMSHKGNCWDNAVAERFFLNLKMEPVGQRDYANHAEAKIDIAADIVGFYNSERLHSVLGNLPPPSSNETWLQKNLWSCPNLLDRYSMKRPSLSLG
jgi:transposase InsO family protein